MAEWGESGVRGSATLLLTLLTLVIVTPDTPRLRKPLIGRFLLKKVQKKQKHKLLVQLSLSLKHAFNELMFSESVGNRLISCLSPNPVITGFSRKV